MKQEEREGAGCRRCRGKGQNDKWSSTEVMRASRGWSQPNTCSSPCEPCHSLGESSLEGGMAAFALSMWCYQRWVTAWRYLRFRLLKFRSSVPGPKRASSSLFSVQSLWYWLIIPDAPCLVLMVTRMGHQDGSQVSQKPTISRPRLQPAHIPSPVGAIGRLLVDFFASWFPALTLKYGRYCQWDTDCPCVILSLCNCVPV